VDEVNKVVGGLGDGKSLEDLAAKHNVPIEQIKSQFDKGIEVEKEHTTDAKTAAEIATDHLTEDPLYYDKLAKVEQTPAETPKETPPPAPVINIDEIVAKAVNAAVSQVAAQFMAKMQEDQAKRDAEKQEYEAKRLADIQAEKEKHDADIRVREQQIAELKRTAPTGVPGQQVQVGSEEMIEAEKKRLFVENYRKGYR